MMAVMDGSIQYNTKQVFFLISPFFAAVDENETLNRTVFYQCFVTVVTNAEPNRLK